MIIGVGSLFTRKRAGIALPAPVAAYIAAAGITNPTEKTAVTNLYNSLVSAGVYSRFDRLQPISPSSLSAAAFDLVTATATITWVNSPTDAASGVTFDGATQYGLDVQTMDQYPIYGLANDQGSAGIYVTGTGSGSGIRQLMGAGALNGFQRSGTGNMNLNLKSGGQSPGVLFSTGFWAANKFTSSNFSMYKNGSLIGNSSVPSSGTAPAIQMAWGCLNTGGNFIRFLSETIAFGYVGGSFTDAEQAQISTIVNAYQTALSRNVY